MDTGLIQKKLTADIARKSFDVTLFRVRDAITCILFAPGLGGNPL